MLSLFGLVQAENPLFGLIGTEDQANVRATALLVALWYGVFALPLFLVTPDQPATGVGLGEAVRAGLKSLLDTLRHIRRYGNIVRWLIASALYRDGLNTLFAFGGIYAAGTFGMTFQQIVMFAIALNVASAAGAFGFAWIDDWIGPKRTILGCLAGLIAFGIPLLFAESQTAFWGLALGLGIFVGPAQAAGRTMMAKLSPPAMETEMFGLYALSGRAVSFVGTPGAGVGHGIVSKVNGRGWQPSSYCWRWVWWCCVQCGKSAHYDQWPTGPNRLTDCRIRSFQARILLLLRNIWITPPI